MKKLLIAAVLVLMATVAKADDNQHWAIQNGGNWTNQDNVSVDYWFTENGNMVGTAQLFIGPLVAGQTARPVDTKQFVNSGRSICLNADAFRAAVPNVKVTAVPSCFTFPFVVPIDAPIITTTP